MPGDGRRRSDHTMDLLLFLMLREDGEERKEESLVTVPLTGSVELLSPGILQETAQEIRIPVDKSS